MAINSLFGFIKNKFATENRRRLLENFFSLSLLQTAGYVLPLITVPYLTRVIGVEKFGMLAFAQGLMGYFGVFIDYGFALSATRDVSVNRKDPVKISEIFCSVLLLKLIFFLVSLVLLSVIVFMFTRLRVNAIVYFLSFAILLGNVLFPTWFFQGIEQMKYITFLNILARLLFTVLVFVYVKNINDFVYVPALTALGGFVAGVLALFVAYKQFNIYFHVPKFAILTEQLRAGWHIFTSMVFISLYTSGNTFFLGLFTNNVAVGYFAAAEKLVNAIKGLTVPVSQTVYPYFSVLFSENAARAKALLRKMAYFVGIVTLAVSILVSVFAPALVQILFGKSFGPSTILVRILIFTLFATSINNVFGVQGLLAFNYKKEFNRIFLLAGTLHLIIFPLVVVAVGLLGAPIVILFTETFICLIQYPVLRRNNLI